MLIYDNALVRKMLHESMVSLVLLLAHVRVRQVQMYCFPVLELHRASECWEERLEVRQRGSDPKSPLG